MFSNLCISCFYIREVRRMLSSVPHSPLFIDEMSSIMYPFLGRNLLYNISDHYTIASMSEPLWIMQVTHLVWFKILYNPGYVLVSTITSTMNTTVSYLQYKLNIPSPYSLRNILLYGVSQWVTWPPPPLPPLWFGFPRSKHMLIFWFISHNSP